MKLAIAIFLLGLSTLPVSAKWAPLSMPALIKESDAIVIADYSGYTTLSKPQNNYDQLGAFKLIKPIKGKIDPTFNVFGRSIRICAPQFTFQDLKPGRYLLCLTKRPEGWFDCNAFITPINDDQVLWFKSSEGIEKQNTSLTDAIREIESNG